VGLASSNIRGGTRVLLVIEGTTVALILLVSVIILIRLATGTAPNGNTLRLRARLHSGSSEAPLPPLARRGRTRLARHHLPRSGVPARSTATVAICAYVIILLGWLVFGLAPFDLFVASGTIGTLILLLVYALTTIGAAKLLFLSGERRVAAWEVVVPFLALVVIGYTLFRNIYPFSAAGWYPIIAGLWVIVGIVITFVRNAATRRAGEKLTAEEGLAAGTGSRT
jgi:hypothetical protein